MIRPPTTVGELRERLARFPDDTEIEITSDWCADVEILVLPLTTGQWEEI